MLAACMNILLFSLGAQNIYTLSGRVLDEKGHPLPGAAILLSPGNEGTVAGKEGFYSVRNIARGTYRIEISFIGYQKISDTLSINQNMTYSVNMDYSPLSLQEVVITDHIADSRKREEPLNIEIVNDEYLSQNLGGSLMQSLERLPGISSMNIGSGHSKPVIRGLGFNRLVVVENGIKHEGQQWGVDHGLEIDQYSIDNIEIIKGPSSLTYGSDAIAGVIQIEHDDAPARNSFKGEIDLFGRSNNNLIGSSLSISGRKDWFFLALDASLTDYGDYRVPTDSIDIYSYRAALQDNYLRNTAGYERNFGLNFGINKKRFTSKFSVSKVGSKSGFFANTHGLEPRNVNTVLHDGSNRDILDPYQQVSHFKFSNSTRWINGSLSFETDMGFQRNFRQEWSQYVNHGYMPDEFPDTLGYPSDLERQFDKYILSFNLKTNYYLYESTRLSAGLQAEQQDNRIGGRGFIIPEFLQNRYGAYFLAEHDLSQQSSLRGGMRYDLGFLQTESYHDWFRSPVSVNGDSSFLKRAPNLSREFSNFSWSIGYNLNRERTMLKINLGKSFRMPVAKELASNGVNYHRFSYEKGNLDLSPEISWQLDAGLEYKLKRFAIGTTPFVSYFPNYIYLNPGYKHDRLYGNGNQVFTYVKSEVFRYGGEIHAHYRILKSLKLGVIGEYVYSEQLSGEKKGYSLPFSPPPSAVFNIRYHSKGFKFTEEIYATLDYRLAARQENIVPPEEKTPGYQVVNFGMGGKIKINSQTINVSLQINNLLNTKYFEHTSYYRLINVPEPGRNFVINIGLPFSGNLN